MADAVSPPLPGLTKHWPLVLALALLGIPTLIRLAEQVWPMEIGAHGPIVLATGAWLLFYVRGELMRLAEPSRPVGVAVLLAIALPMYVFGRAYDLLVFEAAGLYLFFVAIAYHLLGWRAIRANLFPFIYLLFLVPAPGWILEWITMPLRHLASWVATGILSAFDYPIQREGIVILIGSYRLLVEDACSGMNSLIGLTAVILFYIYIIHGASLRYSALLAVMVIPIAIAVNVLRIMALILLTYYQGDAVAQGFLHMTTGILLFAAALGLVIGLDWLLQAFLARRGHQVPKAVARA